MFAEENMQDATVMALNLPNIFVVFLSYLLLLINLLSSFSALSIVASNLGSPFPGCPDKCGRVDISYPFGIGGGCFFEGFEVTCLNQSVPFLAGSNLQLIEILQGEVRIDSRPFTYSACTPKLAKKISLPLQSPFIFSERSNKFVVIGCNYRGIIRDLADSYNSKYCDALCHAEPRNGNCNPHRGCCEAPLPRVKNNAFSYFTAEFDGSTDSETSPCSTAFIVEDRGYTFNVSDIYDFSHGKRSFAMKLKWAIADKNAENDTVNLCGDNSYPYKTNTISSHLCKCLSGYEGNPYLNGSKGCQDPSNCTAISKDACVPEATCHFTNSVSDLEKRMYSCICPAGTSGDGLRRTGKGCKKHSQAQIKVVFTAAMLIIVLTCCISLLYWVLKKRSLSQIKAKYFHQNGGLFLQAYVTSKKATTNYHPKIFTAQELEKATASYDRSRVLGHGGQGTTVYEGILSDGCKVAIKKSQSVDQRLVKQFINELIILTHINHRNIVKMIGCCLETEIPLVVYEFISGGTLYEKLHGTSEQSIPLSWKDRLRIGIEVGEALSYLHSYASMPIFHRDVKSSNILLNENNTAKLADFGISRLVPPDKGGILTAVQGTIGYLDPEYLSTGKLTEKSDVYSFGVVLLELLTGKEPVRHDCARDYSTLVMLFQSYIGKENIFEILDEGILEKRNLDEIKVVCGIASKCLNVFGTERPTMKYVVQELLSVSSEKPRHPFPIQDEFE